MQILITGGAGFIGNKLGEYLINNRFADSVVLVDKRQPESRIDPEKINCIQADLTNSKVVNSLVTADFDVVIHLAAVVSSHAEAEFDDGWKVNVDATRNLLEACRNLPRRIKFIFASSIAAFGGSLPDEIQDSTALQPSSSYGAQKAVAELIVNDYCRKGFIDARIFRLPTICVRPGAPNLAASSFVSSIIREPLQGKEAICPVSEDLSLWLSSPNTVVYNLWHGVEISGDSLGNWRVVNLPGITVTVREMLDSLIKQAGENSMSYVKIEYDGAVNDIVSSWPARFNIERALSLGFKRDQSFDSFIRQHVDFMNSVKNKYAD